MAIKSKRYLDQLEEVLKMAESGKVYPVYLFIGDRPIISPHIERLIGCLIPEGIDDFNLDILPADSFSEGTTLELLDTRGLFPGRKVVLLQDPPFLVSAGTTEGRGILSWLVQRADPSYSVLIIESELVDRRGPFYRGVKGYGPILDLDREKRDKRQRARLVRDLITMWFRDREVKIGTQAINYILEQVGDEDLVALKTEVKKLLSQAKRHTSIGIKDVQDLVVRHREEELYRLTDALGNRDLDSCLSSLDRLLDQGVHPLAILQTIANFLQKMIILRSSIEYGPGLEAVKDLSYEGFKNKTLPQIKESLEDVLPIDFKTLHPYVLYKMSRHVEGFELKNMLALMSSMAELDLEIKGNHVSDRVIIERLIFQLIPCTD